MRQLSIVVGKPDAAVAMSIHKRTNQVYLRLNIQVINAQHINLFTSKLQGLLVPPTAIAVVSYIF